MSAIGAKVVTRPDGSRFVEVPSLAPLEARTTAAERALTVMTADLKKARADLAAATKAVEEHKAALAVRDAQHATAVADLKSSLVASLRDEFRAQVNASHGDMLSQAVNREAASAVRLEQLAASMSSALASVAATHGAAAEALQKSIAASASLEAAIRAPVTVAVVREGGQMSGLVMQRGAPPGGG